MSYENQIKIAELCSQLRIDGLRGDLVVNCAARMLTALTQTKLQHNNLIKEKKTEQ